MNADPHASEDPKNTGKGNQSVIFGVPEITLIEETDGKPRVQVYGVDVLKSIAHLSALIQHETDIELFHDLFLSALRRCRRAEHALAVFDAQSEFTVFVASVFRVSLV